MALQEIFADQMVAMSLNASTKIVKLVFASSIPDSTGKSLSERVLILTLPTDAAHSMLEQVRKTKQTVHHGTQAMVRN